MLLRRRLAAHATMEFDGRNACPPFQLKIQTDSRYEPRLQGEPISVWSEKGWNIGMPFLFR